MTLKSIPFWVVAIGLSAYGQQSPTLTLQEAEDLAIKNHPRIAAASLNADAARAIVPQARSALLPVISGNLTSVGADRDTAIAAGTLQTSGLASRAATGIGFSQLITDFGRTAKLVDVARLRAAAQKQNTSATRAQVLLQVDQAYYAVLSAESVLKVAQARVDMHRVTVRQVRALADNHLRSTLDVSFAEVALSEAELALFQAENSAKASKALLTAAMGESTFRDYSVVDVPLPPPVTTDESALVREALANRPELSVAKLNQSAADRLAEAESKLWLPSITTTGVLGVVPVHQKGFSGQYSAAGINISVPFLNGGLFAGRKAEAELRARAADKETDAISVQVAGGVRVALLETNNAWQRIQLTARLVDQATVALRLARARYDIGLSGILELTQSQVALTSAQISAATARYDYLTRVANLNFVTGATR